MIINSAKDLALQVTGQRKKLKLSQSAVADRVGLKQKTISAFENKPENSKVETLFLILSAVNMDIQINPKDQTITTWTKEW